jgi:ribosome-associated translation inhibitor RaiA
VQIKINTDNTIDGNEAYKEEVREIVAHRLVRFGERVTRVEVHLTDVNAQKGGKDTRCVIEARLSGLDPVTVDELELDMPRAARGAADKLVRALDTRLGKLGRR